MDYPTYDMYVPEANALQRLIDAGQRPTCPDEDGVQVLYSLEEWGVRVAASMYVNGKRRMLSRIVSWSDVTDMVHDPLLARCAEVVTALKAGGGCQCL